MAIGDIPSALSANRFIAISVGNVLHELATAPAIHTSTNLLTDAWQVKVGSDPHIYEVPLNPMLYHYTEECVVKKTQLIRLIDGLLFANLQCKILEIYNRARVVNGGVAFKYHFFAEGGNSHNPHLMPPSEATIEFLFKYVVEFKPAIENRQAINYLIIRFLNECYEPHAVLKLLPPKILPPELLNALEEATFSTADEDAIAKYKADPSFNLIKRQIVFNTME